MADEDHPLIQSAVKRLSRYLCEPDITLAPGDEIPGLGHFVGFLRDMDLVVLLYNNDIGSTRAITMSALIEMLDAMPDDQKKQRRRAITRGVATLVGDDLHVETSAETEGFVAASTESRAVRGEQSVYSRSEAVPSLAFNEPDEESE